MPIMQVMRCDDQWCPNEVTEQEWNKDRTVIAGWIQVAVYQTRTKKRPAPSLFSFLGDESEGLGEDKYLFCSPLCLARWAAARTAERFHLTPGQTLDLLPPVMQKAMQATDFEEEPCPSPA